MADIRPFRAVRYDPAVAGDLSPNLCPTYVLSEHDLEDLYSRSEYNIIRLELAYDWSTHAANESRYMRSARTRVQWLMSGVLRRDVDPSMYVVEEVFNEAGAEFRRIGLVAAVRIEDYDAGIVLPHELTEQGPVHDRLSLMKATFSNFSPLMSLYRDGPDAPVASLLWQIAHKEPDVVANPPDLPSIRMWCVTDPTILGALRGAFSNSEVYIADGHHRYEAAQAFRDYARDNLGHDEDDASQFRVMTLVAFDDPGLFLRGYHRDVTGATEAEILSLRAHIAAVCDLQEWQPPKSKVGLALEHRLAREPEDQTSFGVVGLEPGKIHIATMNSEPSPDLDVADATDYGRLHREILRGIFGPSRELNVVGVKNSADQAINDALSGDSEFGFVMRPISTELAWSVIKEGKLLPIKSTYFHPKISSGLVIQNLDGDL